MIETKRPPSLVEVLRQPPALTPEASVSRALELLRYGGTDTVPITDGQGRFKGIITARDLVPLLGNGSDEERLFEPVDRWMRWPDALARSGMATEEVREIIVSSGETSVVVLDADDRYIGIVSIHDLLLPVYVRPNPPLIGGMATPWGVYLTSGGLQAGAGNMALVGTGVLLGSMLALSYFIVEFGAWSAQKLTGWPLDTLLAGPASNVALVLKTLSLPVFLLLMRSLPLSRYHAAEHQVVHAVERGEPLVPEVVRRMPRVHPRCGTNLMAAALVFGLVIQIVSSLRLGWLDAGDGAVLGVIAAATTWRSLGAWLQDRFTTRTAGTKHLESGIAAATDLQERYLQSGAVSYSIRRRIWCSGMVQVMAGAAAATAVAFPLTDWLLQQLR